jgi:hypothetical protein
MARTSKAVKKIVYQNEFFEFPREEYVVDANVRMSGMNIQSNVSAKDHMHDQLLCPAWRVALNDARAKNSYNGLSQIAGNGQNTSANEIKKECHTMMIKGRSAKDPGDKFPTSRTSSMMNKNRLLSTAVATMHSTLL